MTGSASPRTLPIRVAVAAGESLDSWLEASCRRLEVTTGVLLAAVALRTHPQELHGLPDYTVVLHPAEAHRLGVVGTDQRLPLLPQVPIRARRTVAAALAAVVDVCLTDHGVLLHDTCPACGQVPRRISTSHSSLRPAGTCLGTIDRPCGTDLRTIDPLSLAADGALLATQRWINTLLSAVEAGTTAELAATPAVVFGDLRVVGCWLLRHAAEEDFQHFGAHVQRAWQAHHARAASRTWSGAAPPAAAAVMGAAATRAAALLIGDDQEATTCSARCFGAAPTPASVHLAWPWSSGGSCRTRSRPVPARA